MQKGTDAQSRHEKTNSHMSNLEKPPRAIASSKILKIRHVHTVQPVRPVVFMVVTNRSLIVAHHQLHDGH